jgi:uncharacterized membrane protein YedE/YeeE
MNPFAVKKWNPYLVGVLIGVLSWVTFYTMSKQLGTSTSMVHAAGLATAIVAPEHAAQNPYYQAEITPKNPMFDWQMFLVLALPVGALLGAWLTKDFNVEKVPALWRWRFGELPWRRYLGAFLGGAILLFGARMAGGCTSGHGISGCLQLAVSSWVFFMSMFVSGVVTAFVLFGKEGRSHV